MISNTPAIPLWLRGSVTSTAKSRYSTLERPIHREELRESVEEFQNIILSTHSSIGENSILMNIKGYDIQEYAKIKAIFELYRSGSRWQQIRACEYISDLLMVMSVRQWSEYYAPILSFYFENRVNLYLNELDAQGRERNLCVVPVPSHLEMWFALVFANPDLDRDNAGRRAFLLKEERRCKLNSSMLQNEPDLETLRNGVLERMEELKGLIDKDQRKMEIDEAPERTWLSGCFDEDTQIFDYLPEYFDIQILSDNDVMMVDHEEEGKTDVELPKSPSKRKLNEVDDLDCDKSGEEVLLEKDKPDEFLRPKQKVRLNSSRRPDENPRNPEVRIKQVYSDFALEIQCSDTSFLEDVPNFEPFGKNSSSFQVENDGKNENIVPTGTVLEELEKYLDPKTLDEFISCGVEPEELLLQFLQQDTSGTVSQRSQHVQLVQTEQVEPVRIQPDYRPTGMEGSWPEEENLNDEQMLQKAIRESMETCDETKTRQKPPIPSVDDLQQNLSDSDWGCEDDDPGSDICSEGGP